MGFSGAVRNEMLDWWIGNPPSGYLPPTEWYVALVRTDDSEVVGGGYMRLQTDTDDWVGIGGGEVTNISDLTWVVPTADWGTVHKVKLYDQLIGGTELAEGDLTTPVAIFSGGTTPEITAGNFSIQLTGGFNEDIRDEMLDWWFGNPQSGYIPPEDFYVTLVKTNGEEVPEESGNNYARVHTDACDWGSGGVAPSPEDGTIVNVFPITFPAPTAGWGDVNKVRLLDQAYPTSGEIILAEGDIIETYTVTGGGVTPEFIEGAFKIKLL